MYIRKFIDVYALQKVNRSVYKNIPLNDGNCDAGVD